MTLPRVDIADSRDAVEDALTRSQIEPLVITRDGKPVAALVPIEDVDLESLSLSHNPEFIAMLERSRRSAKEKGTIPFEEMKRRLGMSDE
jgi:hypothetical protein